MTYASVLFSNHIQTVCIPQDMCFTKETKRVLIRQIGNERILSPIEYTWDSFFLNQSKVSDDFMVERDSLPMSKRLSFD